MSAKNDKTWPIPSFQSHLAYRPSSLILLAPPGNGRKGTVQNPEVMVGDRPIEGQNISASNLCSVDIVIVGLRKGGRGSVSQNGNPDERRPVTHLSKEIRDH